MDGHGIKVMNSFDGSLPAVAHRETLRNVLITFNSHFSFYSSVGSFVQDSKDKGVHSSCKKKCSFTFFSGMLRLRGASSRAVEVKRHGLVAQHDIHEEHDSSFFF